MARRVEITLQDDLDGTGADETVTFSLDGVDYEIDLSSANASKLRSVFEPYAEKGRRTGSRRNGIATFVTTLPPANSTLRAWGQARGYRIPDRGRIPAEVRQAYAEAEQEQASSAG
jgi:hypothetical protein